MLDIKLKLKPGHRDPGDWMAPSPLRALFWNVTYRCNFHCPVCFSNAGAAEANEMTTAQAREFIRRVHALGVKSLILSGGEPFVRPDLLDLLRHMADLGITARIASNGSLLTDDLLRRLREETMTVSFMINLDSLDPATYGAIHGTPPEAVSSAVTALRRVRAHGFHTTLAVRLLPATLRGIPDILDLAAAEDWRTLGLMLPLPVGRTAGTFAPETDVIAMLEPVFEHFLSLPDHWLV
ncbi:MAG TPA: radical SAM protein, partial [Planctomycetota bacterium]|nr:radical SAM protein [Planctomycetota bacterium]